MQTIPIPEGIEISESDIQAGTIEITSEFTINAEAGTLTLVTVGGSSVMEEEEVPLEDPTEDIPTEESSIADFVSAQRSQMGA